MACSSSRQSPATFLLFSFTFKVYNYFEKGQSEKLCTRQSPRVMGYDQYTVPDIVAMENTFDASFSTLKNTYKATRAILSNLSRNSCRQTSQDCRGKTGDA